MVSRYHWVTLQTSGPLPNAAIANLMDLNAAIPAGGILKKILVNRVYMSAKQDGTDNTAINPWLWTYEVRILGGPNDQRLIYESARRIPVTAVTISAVAINFYTGYYNAGEKELGVDQKMSYGKASDPLPYNVHFLISQVGLVNQNHNFAISYSQFAIQAKALYYK